MVGGQESGCRFIINAPNTNTLNGKVFFFFRKKLQSRVKPIYQNRKHNRLEDTPFQVGDCPVGLPDFGGFAD